MSKNEVRKHVGDISQIADMRLMSFEEGKARGMRSIECKTGRKNNVKPRRSICFKLELLTKNQTYSMIIDIRV